MLQNKHYLGDEFYPPIIDEETFEKAREEKKKCDRGIITLEEFKQWLAESK